MFGPKMMKGFFGWGHGFGPRRGRVFEKGDLKYVILDLLKDKPSHGYEVIRALEERSRGFYSPSPGSVYPTLQLLEDLGYVSATQRDGKKVYEITDEGRQALRCWLAEPGRAPVVEFEGLVKVLFAEQAGKEELLATLGSIRTEAERTRHHHAELAADLAETGGPFPERLHLNALVFAFMWEQSEALLRWVGRAEQEVARWSDDISRPPDADLMSVLTDAAASSR